MDHDIIEELDDLISDIHGLIDEKEPAQEEESPADLVLPEFLEEAMPEGTAAEEEIASTEVPAEEENFHNQRWTERQKVPKHVAKLQQNQEEAYAKWLQEQAEKAPEPPPEFPEEKVRRKKYETDTEDEPAEVKPKKKKVSTALWLCLFAVIVTHNKTKVTLVVSVNQ